MDEDDHKDVLFLYRILRWAAIFPLTERLGVSFGLVVYTLAVNVAVVSTLVIKFLNSSRYFRESNVAKWFAVQVILTGVSFTVILLTIMTRRAKLKRLYSILTIFDRNAGLCKSRAVYEFLLSVAAETVVYMPAAIANLYFYGRIQSHVVIVYLVWIFTNLHVKCLLLPTGPIRYRMCHLIGSLKRTDIPPDRYSQLSDSYYLLVDSSQILNEIIGFPLAFQMLELFIQVVLTTYLINLLSYNFRWDRRIICALMLLIMMLVGYFYSLLLLVSRTSSLSNKVRVNYIITITYNKIYKG